MDFCPHDLKQLLQSIPPPGFRSSEVKTLMQQLLGAVAHLHANHLVHRDLKTSNLLLTNDGLLKVADFGLVRRFSSASGVDGGGAAQPPRDPPLTQLVVTLWYRAPELLLGAVQYASAVDVWSVGCIFAELVVREPLFPGRGELDQIERIGKMLGTPPEALRRLPLASTLNLTRYGTGTGLKARVPGLTDAGYDLLLRLLEYDPAKRITAREALEHPYFREHPPPKDPRMFPTFPSKANGEVKKRDSPSAPVAGHGGQRDGTGTDAGVEYAALFRGGNEEGESGGFQLRG